MKRTLIILTSLLVLIVSALSAPRIYADNSTQVNQLIAQALSPIINNLQSLQNQLAGDENKISQQDQRITSLENATKSASPILGIVANTNFAHEDVCLNPSCSRTEASGPVVLGNFGIFPTVYISTGQGYNLTDTPTLLWGTAHFPSGDVKSNVGNINGDLGASLSNKPSVVFSDPNPSTDPTGTRIPIDLYVFYGGVVKHYQFDVINDGNSQSWQSWTNSYSE